MARGVKGGGEPMGAEERQLRKRDAARKRYAANPEKINADRRRRRAANPEKYRDAERRRCDANPERRREINRKSSAARPDRHWRGWMNPDGTPFKKDDRDKMFLAQNGVCKICSKPPALGKNLVADHDHKTMFVRGLLCHVCNTGLGKLGDNVAGLKSALEYVQAACA